MISDFDIAQWLMGSLHKTVYAKGLSIVDTSISKAGDVDTAVITLGYADGRLAVIKNSRRAVYGYDQRVELLGSEGRLQVENMRESTVRKSTTTGVMASKASYFFLERYMPAYAIEWSAFVAAVADSSPVPVTLAAGFDALGSPRPPPNRSVRDEPSSCRGRFSPNSSPAQSSDNTSNAWDTALHRAAQ